MPERKLPQPPDLVRKTLQDAMQRAAENIVDTVENASDEKLRYDASKFILDKTMGTDLASDPLVAFLERVTGSPSNNTSNDPHDTGVNGSR